MNAGVFRSCLDYLDQNPQVGVLTCKVLLPDGQLDLACRRSFPNPWVALCRLVGLSYLFPKSRLFAQYNLTYMDENEVYPVDAVMGAFMMIRREAFLEVGVLDEGFFMYGEDLDWCYRFNQAGYEVVYFPKVSIWHYKGASSNKRRSPVMIREFHKAMHIFVRKNIYQNNFFLFNWMLILGVNLHYYYDLIKNKLYRVKQTA